MITIDGVTKRYGRSTVLDGGTFAARAGQVTGFLGPNGAGKSTTMRIVAGLTAADRGRATIGGRQLRDFPNPGRHVGVLLDASAQHSGRSGREVLTLATRTMGLPDSRVDELLDEVGLDARAGRQRVGNYSLGMRQRLGIAHAMAGDPEVLILDEPANGLDPAGIRWMRDLLRSHAARGHTVLLSSHLLHEVEQVADTIVVIGRGRILASGSTSELLASTHTFARATDIERLAGELRSAGGTVSVDDDGMIADVDPAAVGRVALAAGVPLVELRPAAHGGLEELFLRLTSDPDDGLPT